MKPFPKAPSTKYDVLVHVEHGTCEDWKWWCHSCGTLTNDGECDCTKYGNADTQILVRNP